MTLSFYWYPKCGTCRNAKKWLDENQIDYKAIHMVEEPPSESQLLHWMETSDIPAKKFFNTSGKKYRERQLKEKINDLSPQEMAEILASDGMLIKRPVLTDGDKVTVGFNEETYAAVWK